MPAVNPRNIRSSRPPSLPKVIADVLDPRPAISDAYWSATHPVDRIMGRGRAKGGQMIFPWGAKFPPKSFPVGPPGSGLTAHRLPVSPDVPLAKDVEDTLTWRGNLIRTGFYQGIPRGMPRDSGSRVRFENAAPRRGTPVTPRTVRATAREEQGMPVSYNIVRDKDGKLVGATHMRLFEDATEVDEVFLKKNVRGSTTVLKDIVGVAIDRGLPIRAVPGNPKVGRLLDRLMKSHYKGKEGRPPVRTDWDPSSPSGRARREAVARQLGEQNPANREVQDISGLDVPDPHRVVTRFERPAAQIASTPRRNVGPPPAPHSPSPLRDAIAAAAEQRVAQQQALARAQMLARQRRAPNPIRISRPGRGGV